MASGNVPVLGAPAATRRNLRMSFLAAGEGQELFAASRPSFRTGFCRVDIVGAA